MLSHLLKRLLLTLPALWLVLTLVFLMIHIVPGDPVEQMLGEGAAPGAGAQLRHALNLDRCSVRSLCRRFVSRRPRAIFQISSSGAANYF